MKLWRTKELLFVILTLMDISRSQTMKQNTWRLLSSPYIQLQNIYKKLKTPDHGSCASSCLWEASCINFYYNPQTTDCTQGGWLITTTTPIAPSSDIYANGFYCDVLAYYTVYSNLGSVCVYKSDYTLNYTSALSVCRDKNASLYKVENLGKFNMLVRMTTNLLTLDVWVGVEDLDQDDTFRHSFNGKLLGSNFESQIFDPGYKNNTVGQNCGLFIQNSSLLASTNTSLLVSTPCSTPQYFLCEMFEAP
ncbi:unnamed protein product [Lymnaea stagnalis]|uniref:C-type lectin domain-containing protein n=1 Tax=Lymnaea stagnalis TaxID=6523 RepID=A0AAV2I608_LYMST